MKTHRYSLAATLVAIVTLPSVRADYSSTVMGLNPVAYYRLNETTPVPADTATNLGTAGANGTAFYINDPLHQAPGALPGSTDTAVGLNGTSQRVATLFDSSINPTGPFTAEAWVNPATAQTGSGLVCPLSFWTEAAGPTGRTGWLIYQSPTGWNLRMYNGINSATVVSVTGGDAPNVGSWYHLALVYDGSTVNLYVNGVPTGPQSTTGYAPNIGGPLSIGARADGNFWFAGYADEVALYTNALSGTDIQNHYQNGTNASPSQTYNSLVLASNPILYYRLDEPEPTLGQTVTAVNVGSLGSGADGTYQPGTVTGVSGPPYAGFGAGNYACRFNGSSGYIDCGFPGDLDAYSGPISIMTWIHVNGWNKSWQAMVTKGDSSWRLHRAQISGTDTRFVGFGTTGLSNVDQAGTRAVDDGFWHHVVAVYDGSAKYIYVDGTLDVSTPVTGTLATDTYAIFIGGNAQVTGRLFSGLMDEVAIFTNGLSAAQILQVYDAAQVPPIITQQPQAPGGPFYEGYNITVTAAAIGALPLTNHWYKNNTLLTNRTSLTLSITNAAVGDSGSYTLVVANAYGSITSAVQVITVSSGPPLFLSQSIFDATRAIGGRVTYSVVAGGSAPVSYQWNHGSTAIPGATASVLRLTNLQLSDQGSYTVTITNPYGTNNNSATGVVSVVTVTNYPFAAMYGNPLAYYRLNETSGTTASDIADGLNGTLIGPMVTGVAGPQPPAWVGLESTNTAFQFDGASTRVQLPSFNLQTNQMTIVAWINPAGPQSDQTGILASRSPTGLGGFFLNYNNNNALSYVWQGSSSWNTFQSGLVPVVGQWNFAALVIDPTKGTVYLDKGDGTGLQSAVYTSQGNQTVIWDSPNIGVDLGYPRWFNGSIDEVVVYDRALSPAEIANLDLLGSAGPVAPRIVQQPASQTVYAGKSAAFNVGALGALPLAFQWQHAGTNLPGATSATLMIPSAYYTDAGNYSALITNSMGSSNSVTATLTVLAPPTFANLTNDLVLHLTFDTNSSGVYPDSSGRGNNATAVGSPTLVAGKLGQAFHYNTDNPSGIYNYATLGSPSDLQFGTSQNFSVAYWVRFTGTSVDLPVLCNNDCGEGCIGFYFGPSVINNNGGWAWSLCNSSYAGPVAEGAANSINDGQWHNVVSTFDRTGLGMTYLDGVLVDSRPVSTFTDTLDTANPVNVGQVGSADYKVLFGADVDDLGVWLRALSPTEAQSIYMVGQQGRSFDTYGPVILSLRKAGNDLELVWQTGTLLSSTTGVLGTYNPVPGASAPYYRVTPGPASTFYRVKF
jgi:hypothetical protein